VSAVPTFDRSVKNAGFWVTSGLWTDGPRSLLQVSSRKDRPQRRGTAKVNRALLQRPAAKRRNGARRADPPTRFSAGRFIDGEGEATLTALAMVAVAVGNAVGVAAVLVVGVIGDKAQRGTGREVGDHETPSPGVSGRGSVGCPGQRLELRPARNLAQ